MVPTLPYPTPPDPVQIAAERDVYHFRLVVPPVPSLRFLPHGYVVGFGFLVCLGLTHVAAIISRPSRQLAEFIPAAIIDGIALIIFIGMVYLRTHRWTTFEITADRFRTYSRVFQTESPRLDLPRSDILEIRLNRSNGKLILRVHRQEMREIFISTNREATQNVVDKLREALAMSFEALAGAAPAKPAPPPATAAQRQSAMMALNILIVASIAFWWLWPDAAMVLLLVAAIAAIPLGIKLGTQKKDLFP